MNNSATKLLNTHPKSVSIELFINQQLTIQSISMNI